LDLLRSRHAPVLVTGTCCTAYLQVGADEKLSSVIDGESLVNDGSALVIFLVLQQFVEGATLSVGEVRPLDQSVLARWPIF
jgi:NhaP-type Na+/H+ or K+/H+ antiporter